MIVGAIGLAVMLALVGALWGLGEIAIHFPLYVYIAACVAVAGAVLVLLRLGNVVWDRLRPRFRPYLDARRARQERAEQRLRMEGPPRPRTGGGGEIVLVTVSGLGCVGAGPFIVVDGWRSIVADGWPRGVFGLVPVIMGSLVTLFGLLCLGAAVKAVATYKQRAEAARGESSRRVVRGYAQRVDRRDVEGLRRLLRALSRADIAGAAALAALGTCAGLLDGLSFRARRGELTDELRPFVEAWSENATPDRAVAPLAAALASLDRDGHAREAAVTAMAAAPTTANGWFLAERAVDPVEPVRRRALDALGSMLTDDPQTYAPVVHRAAERLGERQQAGELRALAGLEPVEPPPSSCCRHWPDLPCFPVHRERVGAGRA